MDHNQHARRGAFLVVLLALFLSTAACGFPLPANQSLPTASPSQITASATPLIATVAPLPTSTQPAAPTATLIPMLPTHTLPAPVPATPTKAPVQLSEVTIYLIAVGDNGLSGPKIGCGDSAVAVKQPIEPTSGVIRAALNRLFSFKQQNIGESGLYTALWQSDLTLGDARVDNGIATVYLTGMVKMGGVCDTPRFKAQIEQTILAQPGVKGASIFLNGKPIDEVLSLK